MLEQSQALSSLRVWQVGTSVTGAMTSHLLAAHGATLRVIDANEAAQLLGETLDASELPDVVLDAEIGSGDTSCSQLVQQLRSVFASSTSRSIVCRFTPSPPGLFDNDVAVGEGLVNALAGLELLPDASVVEGSLPVASAYAAAIAAIEIMVSLLDTKQYTSLEVPLASIAFTLLGRNLVSPDDQNVGDEMSGPRFPLAEIYQCGDGTFLQSHGTTTRFSDAFCLALGHPEWVESSRAAMKSLPSYDDVDEWRRRISEALQSLSAADAQQRIVEHGGSATVCLNRNEWQQSEQARSAGIFVQRFGSDEQGDDVVVGAPVSVLRDTSSTFEVVAPTPHTDSSLPLAGLRVLDLSIVLAGPTGGRMLAEWGADVIKIDSPTRPVSPFSWLDVNRSKQSLLLDLTTEDGKNILRELLATADVLIENFRAGKLAALGFDYTTVSTIKPGIVYASMNAFDFNGPMEQHPGWEHNAEAVSGMQVARERDNKPQAVPYPVNDYMTGLLGAYGVLLALHQRKQSGKGALVQGSLARSATFTQLARFKSGVAVPPIAATFALVCGGGALRVQGDALLTAETLKELRHSVKSLSIAEATQVVRAKGLAVTVVGDLFARMSAGDLSPFTVEWIHESAGNLRQVFTPFYADHSGLGRPRHVAPDPGSHTWPVLTALGYSESRLSALEAAGVIRGRSPLIAPRR